MAQTVCVRLSAIRKTRNNTDSLEGSIEAPTHRERDRQKMSPSAVHQGEIGKSSSDSRKTPHRIHGGVIVTCKEKTDPDA